ncbi:MAG TPA: ABC transporter ATP-binding protein [Myxococcaceae bacterium]|nr:ABC transporter ATP-binding protein [Myxococcaceae bacterium]
MSVALEGLTVSLRRAGAEVPLVQDVSFRIDPGRVLGLVGESGAGKSLTAAALIGLVSPPVRIAGGKLSVLGCAVSLEDARAVRPLRGKSVGFVPQDPFTSLDPLFPVGDQLVETLRAHLPLDREAARERALRLLADVGLPSPAERFGHYPHQLSGGMRQRVAIALALCAEPPLVVADECTTALDVSTQAQIVSLLARLVEEHGVSVLLITHDLGVVAELATEVAIMYAGRIVERAPVQRLLRSPRHPYTRALLDAVPRVGGEGGGALPAIPGAMPRPGELPPGCAFHPRCPRASERCRMERPPLEQLGDAELACWHPLEPGEAPESSSGGRGG